MELRNKDISLRLQNLELSPEELTDYLVKNHSVYEIAKELAGYLIEETLYQENQVILTQNQAQLVERLFSKLVRMKRSDVGRKARTEKYIRQNQGIDENLFKQ